MGLLTNIKNSALYTSSVKAFTLLEVIVVLLITSTVMSMAMWSYLNASKYMYTYRKNEEANQELALFLHYFRQDVDEASWISDKGYLQMNTGEEDDITYDFLDDYIIRYYYNYPDTFFVHTNDFLLDFEPLNKHWVNKIALDIEISGVNRSMTFYKFYTKQQLYTHYGY